MFASCGRRTEEGNPSDTGTACLQDLQFLLLLTDVDHVCPLACPPLVLCPCCCCFLFLFVLRMFHEDSATAAVCSGRYGLLKGNH